MTFKTATCACALFLAMTAMPEHARAEYKSSYGNFSATVGAVSQYRFRGITQSNENPTAQASLNWIQRDDGGLYLGTWASGVDFADANVEVDIYGGYTFDVAGLGFDFGFVGYLYPGSDSSLDYDFIEAKGAVSYDFGVAKLTGSMYYSPEYFASSGSAIYTVASFNAPVGNTGLAVTGSWGSQWVEDNTAFAVPDYKDWSLGLGYSRWGFDFTGAYVDTSLSSAECADGCDAAGVFSVSKTF